MKLIFSIEGNIGSGKSTLIDRIKFSNKIENVIYLPEPVSIWNEIKDSNGVGILEKYYQDQKRYAFSFQMMAYISRLSLIRKALATPGDCIIITERSIYTDREIFAKMLHDSGKIEDIEYSIYLRWFNEFSEIKLDGIIYVQTTPEICSNRINNRNRKGENSIPLSYLEDCHRYHENWILSLENVLYLDGKPEQDEEMVLKIKDFIQKFLI